MLIHTRKTAWFAALALVSLLTWTACGDDDSSNDSDAGEDAGRGGRGGRAGRSGSGGKGGSGEDDDAGTAGKAGGAGKAGAGGKDPGKNCEGPEGCYSCEPKETLQYLNHCTDSECEPFDNATRLPLLKDGKLPALP